MFDTNTNTYSPSVPLPLGRSYLNLAAVDSCLYSIGGNSAIDETVGVSLVRLCPFENSSGVPETGPAGSFSVSYQAGALTLRTPGPTAAAQLSLYDMSGRLVYSDKFAPGSGPLLEVHPGILPASVYVVQLRTNKVVFTGKVFVH